MKHKFKLDYSYLVLVIAVGVMVLWDYIIGCPTQLLLGISCPGCGMMRAANSLLHFRFYEAFYFNPCIYILPVYCVLYFFRSRMNSKVKTALVISFFVIYISVYIYRLVTGNEVVQNDITNGLLYKLFFR